jgi:hypothetical protein
VLRFYFKMILLGVALAPLLAAVRRLALEAVDPAGLAGSLVISVLVGALFTAVMLAAGYGLKIGEITEMSERVLRALKVRR